MNIHSFSRAGEDKLVLSLMTEFFKRKIEFCYIDVGTNHPINYNDTYLLYKKKVKGILIEPNIKFNKLYNKIRPRDTICNSVISNDNKNVVFEHYNDSSQSAIKKKRTKKYLKIIKTEKFETKTLDQILKNFNINPNKIQLVDIDTEGNELDVLCGFNFDKYKPFLLKIEIKNLGFKNFKKNKIVKFLYKKGYILICKTLEDSFFVWKNSKFLKFLPKKYLTNL